MYFRTILANLRPQFARTRTTILLVALAACVALAIVLALHFGIDAPIRHITRDVPAVANLPTWIGVLSSMGIMLWAASAAICLFAAAVAGRGGGINRIQLFFYWIGFSTILLVLDDLFRVHELIPDYTPIPEVAFFIVYALIMLFFVIYLRDVILQTDFLLLGLAFGCFGFSVVVDLLRIRAILPEAALQWLGEENTEFLIEDGAKFVGIVFWLAYVAHTAAWVLQPSAAPKVAAFTTPINVPATLAGIKRQLRTTRVRLGVIIFIVLLLAGSFLLVQASERLTAASPPPTPLAPFIHEDFDYLQIYDIPGAPLPDYVVDWEQAIRLLQIQLPSEPVTPGETINVAFHLLNRAPIESNLNVLVRVVGQGGAEVVRVEGWPWGAPTSSWQKGEVWRDGHDLAIPAETPPGYYHVELGFYDPATQDILSAVQATTGAPLGELVTVGTLQIGELPEPAEPFAPPVAMGDALTLHGVTILPGESVAPGSEITVRLFWGATQSPSIDYTAFVHLVGPDGALDQPVDKPPLQGFLPTSTWQPGQRVVDDFVLMLPADAAPGTYTLYTGFYDPATLIRLPVVEGEQTVGDALLVGEIRVGE